MLFRTTTATTLSVLALSLTGVQAAPLEKKANGVQVINNCVNSGQVALTFDDGPYQYEGQIASLLSGAKAKGTFFLNGNNYECIFNQVDQIRALHADSHTLGSHTWSHADLTQLDEAGINNELARVEDAFIKILGLKPLYFRPPYGSYNDLVLQVLGQRGYKKMFLWTEDTEDANGASFQQSEATYDGIVGTAPQPHIVLNHSPIQTTADQVVPYAIGKLQGAGYQLVAVDTCLGSQGEWPYQYVGEPGTPDASWTCS